MSWKCSDKHFSFEEFPNEALASKVSTKFSGCFATASINGLRVQRI